MLKARKAIKCAKKDQTVTRKLLRKAIADRSKRFAGLVCYVRNEVASWATGPLHRGPAESSGD